MLYIKDEEIIFLFGNVDLDNDEIKRIRSTARCNTASRNHNANTNICGNAVRSPFAPRCNRNPRANVNHPTSVTPIQYYSVNAQQDTQCQSTSATAGGIASPSTANNVNTSDGAMLNDSLGNGVDLWAEKAIDGPLATNFSESMMTMTDQGQSQRQVDSSGIKTQIFYYMDSVTQPEIIAGLKSVTRGFNHTIFGRLLVPRKSLDAFDRNPEDYMNKVRTRVIRPTSLDFPTFLYDEGVDYDPDDMDNGLLHGKLLVKTYFTLSSAKEWKPETQVSGVDLVAFYNQIIRLFNPVADEDDQEPEEPREPDPWVQETLDWWNFQVGLYRGREHQNRSGTETEDESADDPMEVIKVQRCRRRQAKRGKNASTNNVDHNVDPVLQAALNPQHDDSPSHQAASRENAVTNDNLDNLDPVLRAAPNPQHENAPAEQSTHNHQNDAPLPQNPDALESNLQVQSQGCDSQPREDSTSTPRLTDLDMNRQGAAEPPVTDSNACESRAQKKRQAGSEAASDAKKKKKASVGVRTRSKRKNRS
ncbi:hypothetical protein F5887DRAFT_1285653 [Amanita rubescens]|nr:hypothetical protein F5887DRAFT_1285653 [Amanita rubescens]